MFDSFFIFCDSKLNIFLFILTLYMNSDIIFTVLIITAKQICDNIIMSIKKI